MKTGTTLSRMFVIVIFDVTWHMEISVHLIDCYVKFLNVKFLIN